MMRSQSSDVAFAGSFGFYEDIGHAPPILDIIVLKPPFPLSSIACLTDQDPVEPSCQSAFDWYGSFSALEVVNQSVDINTHGYPISHSVSRSDLDRQILFVR